MAASTSSSRGRAGPVGSATEESTGRGGSASQRRLRLRLEYDGTGLHGWQRQDNGPTVQEHLETALKELLGAPTIVIGASRTDAGVHALGQVAHFDTEHPSIPPHGVRKALNSSLPPAIAVLAADQVPPNFHARFDSQGKHYRYRILCRESRSPIRRNRVWQLGAELDVETMRRGASFLIGEHDFSAFRASGCTAKTATRRITDVAVSRAADEVVIDVRGNAFLRNMVRILAGTLVEVGRGRLAPDSLGDLLASRDRSAAGKTAPAAGLTLVEVHYPLSVAPA